MSQTRIFWTSKVKTKQNPQDQSQAECKQVGNQEDRAIVTLPSPSPRLWKEKVITCKLHQNISFYTEASSWALEQNPPLISGDNPRYHPGHEGKSSHKRVCLQLCTKHGPFRQVQNPRQKGGSELKGSGVQISKGRAGDLWPGSSGHMINHVTKPRPEQPLPGPYLQSQDFKLLEFSSFVMSLKMSQKAWYLNKKPLRGQISLCGTIWHSAFSASSEKILAGWENWDPSLRSALTLTVLAACCHTGYSRKGLNFSKKRKKDAKWHLPLPYGPLASLLRAVRTWRSSSKLKMGDGEIEDTLMRVKTHKALQPKSEMWGQEESGCSSLPPAKIPIGIWKSKVSLLWPQQLYCEELQLIFNRAPRKPFS